MSRLRWAWVGPLMLGLLLDVDSLAPRWMLGVAVGASAAATALLWWCIHRAGAVGSAGAPSATGGPDPQAGPRPHRILSRPGWSALGVAAAILTSTLVGDAVGSLPSAAVLWSGTVATGAVMARVRRPGDTAAVAVLGVSTALVPLAQNDGVTLGLLTLIAVGTSAAIGWQVRERARRVAQTRAQTIAQERAALALELHDSVAHEITGIIVLSQAARTAVHDLPPDAPLRASLGLIESASTRALDQVRTLVDTLREGPSDLMTAPPGADGASTAGARSLRRLVEDVAHADRLTLQLRVDDLPLPTSTWLSLQRIVREALTNVRRHAPAARRLAVSLEARDARAVLTVADDGARRDAPRGRAGLGPGLGSGLSGISERARSLGGSATAGPTDTGWQVTVQIPFDAGAAGPEATGKERR